MIPGVDGVAQRPDGTVVYFAAGDDVLGTMADQAVVDPRRSVELPAGADVARVAAAMNPAMSSWVALRRRVPLQPGQSVLILGATGNAGAMAVQVARRLGAGRIVGAGRDAGRLQALLPAGADEVVQLTSDAEATSAALADAAAETDIVLDYLWGKPTQQAIAALRSANFRLQGSGQGSVSPRGYLAELPALVDVTAAWAAKEVPGERVVLIPG
jgi:NADPH:quinone reductase-like Zn-dependent oxidoreductase